VTQQSRSGAMSRHRGVLWDAVRELLASTAEAHPGEELRVLDLGGGTGGLAVPVAELGHRVTVVDPSPDALAALDRRATEHGVDDRIRGVQGDTADLLDHVGPGELDVVLCHGVLEVVDDPTEALDAIRSAMRPDGLLSVVVAGRYAAVLAKALTGHLSEARALLRGTPTRPHRYVPAELVDLLSTRGFTTERVHAVRVFADLVPSTVFDVEVDAPQALLALEQDVADVEAFAALAAQLHVVARPAAAPGP
jgi:S-adenosylmethionine-dependent methyltransferase